MDYCSKNKYLKYKHKYNKLKNQVGGTFGDVVSLDYILDEKKIKLSEEKLSENLYSLVPHKTVFTNPSDEYTLLRNIFHDDSKHILDNVLFFFIVNNILYLIKMNNTWSIIFVKNNDELLVMDTNPNHHLTLEEIERNTS